MTSEKLTTSGPTPFTVLKAALIILAGAFIFGPTLRGGWLWDDNQEVTDNPVLPDPAGLAKIWAGTAGADYFPLKTTVQWFEWRLWGPNPAGYHAVSVALHLLSALLFWRLLRKLGLGAAWIGGLLFVVHPVAVESVAWAAELKNTLSLPFLLLAMIAYVQFDQNDQKGPGPKFLNSSDEFKNLGPGPFLFYWLSLLCFLLAMLAKSSVVMFPCVILLHAWWKRRRIGGRDLAASAPFFIISLILGAVTLWFQQHRAMHTEPVVLGGLFSRLAGAGLALTFYLWKSVWPAGLSPIYPRWPVDPQSVLPWLPWLAAGAAGAWLWSARSGWGRTVIFGLGFFSLNLLPVLGFVAITYMRITWVADHFAYVSILGVIGLAVAVVDRAHASWPVGTWSCVALAVMVLTVESRRYAVVFRSEESLWTYTLQRNPRAWSAHYNLATRLAQRHELPEAVEHFEQTLRLKPEFTDAHYNLGNTYFLEGRLEEAVGQYAETLRLDPGYVDAHIGLGNIFMRENRLPDAIAQFEEVLRRKPGFAEIHASLGDAWYLAGRVPEAISQYEEALRLKPGDLRTLSHLETARRARRGESPR